jgi:hypothetical protein
MDTKYPTLFHIWQEGMPFSAQEKKRIKVNQLVIAGCYCYGMPLAL